MHFPESGSFLTDLMGDLIFLTVSVFVAVLKWRVFL